MAENNGHTGDSKEESFVEGIAEKIHGEDDSSSSVSSSDAEDEAPADVGPKTKRLFGREKSIHLVLGGGKLADVLLWRNKKASASVLGTAIIIWVLFGIVQYHLVTLVAHILIISLAVLFLWSKSTAVVRKSAPRIPELVIPQEPLLEFASALVAEINRGLLLLREIASGRDLKKFLIVISSLWVLSIVGSSFNFLTVLFLAFAVLHTVPVLYEKHEDKVDSFAEVSTIELKKHYTFVSENYLSKIPIAQLKKKKFAP